MYITSNQGMTEFLTMWLNKMTKMVGITKWERLHGKINKNKIELRGDQIMNKTSEKRKGAIKLNVITKAKQWKLRFLMGNAAHVAAVT